MRHDATTKIDHNHTNELIEQNSIINYLLHILHIQHLREIKYKPSVLPRSQSLGGPF